MHDGDDNIQAGVGTWWFTPNELMSVVEREDKVYLDQGFFDTF